MRDFTPLSIHNGYGNVHMNRFRICVRAPRDRGQIAKIGAEIMTNMPRRRPHPPVQRDHPHPDRRPGHETRDGFHRPDAQARVEDADDQQIRTAVAGLVGTGALVIPAFALVAPLVIKYLGDLAVYYNQHHFLAGRRGFRFDVGSSFGYRDDRVVFETVAIERFSSIAFAGSELAMGSIPELVRQVWAEMLTQFCARHGLEPITGEQPRAGWSMWGGKVHCMQSEVASSVAVIRSNVNFPTMDAEHKDILEPRP
jgi:hypothetical protein